MTVPSPDMHKSMANAIRALSMDAVQKANSGHPGLPMGAADFATVLFTQFLNFDASDPHWPDRDRFILSAGHGSMLLYSLLFLTGYKDMTLEQLKNFRQLGSKTAGHPEYGHASGIETTTGPLGQGLANSVGFAIAERHLAARFGNDLVNHKTYVLAGDGCLMEGISQEAITLAGHLKLNHLIVLWDDNGISIDGKVSMSDSTDQLARFASANWNVSRVDGHNPTEVAAALQAAQSSDKPTMIACKTIIGFGAPTKQGTAATHGSPLGAEEIAGARKALGWDYPPFVVPDEILNAWRAVGSRGASLRKDWEQRLAASSHKAEFTRITSGALPANFDEVDCHLQKGTGQKSAVDRHAQRLAECARHDQRRRARNHRRLRRSHRFQQYQIQGHESPQRRRLRRALCLLRHSRAWHGRRHERHGAARRCHSLWRNLPDLHRLLPPQHSPLGHHGQARDLCDDP